MAQNGSAGWLTLRREDCSKHWKRPAARTGLARGRSEPSHSAQSRSPLLGRSSRRQESCTSAAPCLPRQAGCLARLRYADPTRSAVRRLLRSSSNTTLARFAHKPFSLHELPSGVRTRGLTGGSPERYIAVRRGRSRRGGLSKSPNGPVGGLSPEILESSV